MELAAWKSVFLRMTLGSEEGPSATWIGVGQKNIEEWVAYMWNNLRTSRKWRGEIVRSWWPVTYRQQPHSQQVWMTPLNLSTKGRCLGNAGCFCFSPGLYFKFLVMGFFLFKRNKYRELYFYQMSRLIKEITNSIKTKPSVALSNIMSTDLHGMPPWQVL